MHRGLNRRRAMARYTAKGQGVKPRRRWHEFIMLVVAIGSIVLVTIGFWHDRIDRRSEATSSAWTLITTPAVGNSGKGPALEYLNGLGIPLSGIDLSCERMGGWNDETNECEFPIYLNDVKLKGANLNNANLQYIHLNGAVFAGASLNGIDFSGAYLDVADFSNASLWIANFSSSKLMRANFFGAYLDSADLSDADLWVANLSGAKLMYADLSGANLNVADLSDADLDNANFSGAYISKANFDNVRNLAKKAFQSSEGRPSAWAWADSPPLGIDVKEMGIELCVRANNFYLSTRPDPCIPPPE